MSGDRRKEIVRHLSEENLDRLLAETDDEKVSKRLTFVKRLYKGATLRTLPTMSASQLLPAVAGPDDGTKAGSASRRTSGPVGPRSSANTSDESCSNSSETGSLGKNRRYSISSTRSSVLSTTLSTSVNFSKRSVSPTLSREQSVPLALRTPKRFSTNASATRSTRPKPTSRTTNVTMTTRKAGSSTTSIRTAGLSSASLIRHIHSRGTTLNGCTPSMIRTSPDRWFVTTNQRSASTRSTARAW